jgi:hypothetical protein
MNSVNSLIMVTAYKTQRMISANKTVQTSCQWLSRVLVAGTHRSCQFLYKTHQFAYITILMSAVCNMYHNVTTFIDFYLKLSTEVYISTEQACDGEALWGTYPQPNYGMVYLKHGCLLWEASLSSLFHTFPAIQKLTSHWMNDLCGIIEIINPWSMIHCWYLFFISL